MNVWRIAGVLSLSSVLLISGCFLTKKKPPVPPQAQAPTVEQAPPPAATQPQPQPEQPSATTPPAEQKPEQPQVAEEKKKPHPKHKKPAPTATTAKATTPPPPHKIVIEEGGTAEAKPELSASLPREGVSHDRQTTQQLLDSTDTNLRSIKRQLSSSEQQTVAQIRTYMTQARQAITDGDNVRAHNLALKAHLLSDQLVAE